VRERSARPSPAASPDRRERSTRRMSAASLNDSYGPVISPAPWRMGLRPISMQRCHSSLALA
jgi:hypothetical protein